MIWFIFKTIIFSAVFISLIHYLYSFLMINLTIPKTKDLVHRPVQQYNDMINIIKNSSATAKQKKTTFNIDPGRADTDDDHGSDPDMKNELKNFIKQKMSNAKSSVEGTPGVGAAGIGGGDMNNGFSSTGNYYEF